MSLASYRAAPPRVHVVASSRKIGREGQFFEGGRKTAPPALRTVKNCPQSRRHRDYTLWDRRREAHHLCVHRFPALRGHRSTSHGSRQPTTTATVAKDTTAGPHANDGAGGGRTALGQHRSHGCRVVAAWYRTAAVATAARVAIRRPRPLRSAPRAGQSGKRQPDRAHAAARGVCRDRDP